MSTSRNQDLRQEQILLAAKKQISLQGVESVSMNSLALKTGLSRPALYQYFASREHILAELLIDELADFSNSIDQQVANHSAPLEQIRVWIHYSLAHMSSREHRSLAQISLRSLPDESRGMIRSMHGHLMTALLSPIAELGIRDAISTAHLIYASVSASAIRISEGSDFAKEAAALEQFALSGITGEPRPN